MLASKHADHFPHYRRTQISSRSGVDRDRPTLADWVCRVGYCWAQVRRKLAEIVRTRPAPVAEEGLGLICELYQIEVVIRGGAPEST